MVEQHDAPSTIHTLPFDIKDHLLCLLDSPKDLLSFSLSSKEWATLIIPNHIEYRELRIRANRLAVWKHLATRADLSKSIRSLWLMSKENESKEIFPRTLVPSYAADTVATRRLEVEGALMGQLQNRRPLPEMVKAIKNFKYLKRFSWTASDGHGDVVEEIFDALRRCTGLTALRLGDIIVERDYLGPSASLWKLSNLTELVLLGKEWPMVGQPEEDEEYGEDSLVTMLNLSPNLECLTLTYIRAHPRFVSSPLSSLRKLHLANIPSLDDSPLTDSIVIAFLESHPGIEDLKWYPVNERLTAPPGILPNLKRIYTKHGFATALLRDNTLIGGRQMECISQISLGSNTVHLMSQINSTRLQEVHLWRYEGLEAIKKLAKLCPSIRTLLIPNFGLSYAEEIVGIVSFELAKCAKRLTSTSQEDCVECLSHFPNLEAVLESALWLRIRMMKAEQRSEFLANFLTMCPKLRLISHWISLSDMTHDIVFERSESGKITWREMPSKEDWV